MHWSSPPSREEDRSVDRRQRRAGAVRAAMARRALARLGRRSGVLPDLGARRSPGRSCGGLLAAVVDSHCGAHARQPASGCAGSARHGGGRGYRRRPFSRREATFNRGRRGVSVGASPSGDDRRHLRRRCRTPRRIGQACGNDRRDACRGRADTDRRGSDGAVACDPLGSATDTDHPCAPPRGSGYADMAARRDGRLAPRQRPRERSAHGPPSRPASRWLRRRATRATRRWKTGICASACSAIPRTARSTSTCVPTCRGPERAG